MNLPDEDKQKKKKEEQRSRIPTTSGQQQSLCTWPFYFTFNLVFSHLGCTVEVDEHSKDKTQRPGSSGHSVSASAMFVVCFCLQKGTSMKCYCLCED
jgi:hypothetical protein